MKRVGTLSCAVFILAAFFAAAQAASPRASGLHPQPPLFSTVSKLDSNFFNSFNHCASPDQLRKHASYIASNMEFYHDKGGVTWSRRDYIASVKSNVCGQFRREIVPGSLQVFPIKDYGAIEQGNQKFCWLKSGVCFGAGQFLILWHHLDTRWVVTRAFSYDHHPTK